MNRCIEKTAEFKTKISQKKDSVAHQCSDLDSQTTECASKVIADVSTNAQTAKEKLRVKMIREIREIVYRTRKVIISNVLE